MATIREIQELYIGYLGRAGDKAGVEYWHNEINAGRISLEQVRSNFVNEQPEYAQLYGGLDRAQTVARIYENLFERQFDQAGFDYWVTGAGAGVNADQLIVAFLTSASPADQQVLNHKWQVANAYTNAAGFDAFDRSSATAIIADVDGDAASMEAPYVLLNTAAQFRAETNNPDLRFYGASQKNPNAAESFTLAGRDGKQDAYFVNTENFSNGDTIWLSNLEVHDRLILSTQYAYRQASPSTGQAGTLEVFAEQAGSDVRLSFEANPQGSSIVQVMVVGATVAELQPVGEFL